MPFPKELTDAREDLSTWSILSCYRGSVAQGTHVPVTDKNSIDDVDAMVICVPPESYYLGLKEYGHRGTKEVKHEEWDIVIYEVRKAVGLLRKGNPNMLNALWIDDNMYLKRTAAGDMLVENRDLFVGKHAYKHFVGYAHGQLHRMTHHSYEGYMGKKRKEIVDRFGHDPKNASHLIRILRMGIEFLAEGCLNVRRHDAEELKEIKTGKWSLGQVKREADRLFKLAEEAYVRSDLPADVDVDAINALCIEVAKQAWRERGGA